MSGWDSNRREFMERMLVGSGAVLASSLGTLACATPNRPRVLVLGAGLSGLYTAKILAEAFGADAVELWEAKDRVGGRVGTLDVGDALLEEGGQVLASSYTRLLSLAEQLGVETREPQGSRPRSLFFLGGSPYAEEQWAAASTGLTESERNLPPAALLSRYVGMENPLDSPDAWLKASFSSLDQVSVADLARSRGASEAAISLMNLAPNCNDIEEASALWALRDHHRRRASPGGSIVEIVGGNAVLPEAMAGALKSPLHLNRAVSSLVVGDESVRVTSADGSWVNADVVVSTLPFPVFDRLEVEANFEPRFSQALEDLPYTQITKIFLEATEPFWEIDGSPPGMWTDSVLERVFPIQRKDGSGVWGLLCWADGASAVELAMLNDEAVESRVLGELERMRPATKGCLRLAHRAAWPTDSFALGAYHHFGVGQISTFGSSLSEPQGRLFFAGEHTSVEMAGMEGALESAERVARQVEAFFEGQKA